jgi:hypothetical protein
MPEPVRVTSKVRKPLSESAITDFAHIGAIVHSLTLVHLISRKFCKRELQKRLRTYFLAYIVLQVEKDLTELEMY